MTTIVYLVGMALLGEIMAARVTEVLQPSWPLLGIVGLIGSLTGLSAVLLVIEDEPMPGWAGDDE